MNPTTAVTFSSTAQSTSAMTAVITLALPTTQPIQRIEWDERMQLQGMAVGRVGVQVLLDGRLVWMGSLEGDGAEMSHSGLEMRWGGSAGQRREQRLRVRVWREGREVQGTEVKVAV